MRSPKPPATHSPLEISSNFQSKAQNLPHQLRLSRRSRQSILVMLLLHVLRGAGDRAGLWIGRHPIGVAVKQTAC
jgi:hypothetical protein